MRLKSLLFLFYISLVIPLFAQQFPTDTLKITVDEAEQLFLKNNLGLVVQHYNIDIAQAQVITARLFQNPQINFSSILYNPNTKKILDLSEKDTILANNGEYAVGISQLILTAGKRNKNIKLANAAVDQARFQFFDLLRTLKYTLRNDFFNIYFQQQSEKVYTQEINSLQKILVAFKEQYDKGYIALKEVLRIQSRLYSLQAEYSSLLLNIETTEAEFKTLIRANPLVNIEAVYVYDLNGKQELSTIPYQVILDSALANRTDLKVAQANLVYNNLNLKLQKSIAYPDITLSSGFDKYGSYTPNFNNIGISFAIPIFNRNQGGIKVAKNLIEQAKVQYQQQQNLVEYDVATNYKVALRLEQLTNGFDPKFKQDYSHLIDEVLKNYTIRNIGLLDFLNYYDDFKNNTTLLNTTLANRVTALEKLNFVTGTHFFNK
ncbi:MAG: TolC family protein [Flavisolibacter sp.]